jgi:hypothetical protein
MKKMPKWHFIINYYEKRDECSMICEMIFNGSKVEEPAIPA